MNFISFGFLIFFIFVSAFYYIAGFRARPAFLLLASYFFYSGFGAGFTLLLFAVTVATYALSLFVNNLKRDFWGKSLFVLSVAASLFPLLFFKYFDFLCRSFSDTFLRMGLELGTVTLNLIVPVGISFYSFRVVSYLADVYSGKTAATRSFVKYALYVSYFPQIISGPIERAENFFAQVGRRIEYDPRNLAEGSKLIIFGLFKKLVIADSLAAYVDNVYAAAGM